MPETTFEEKLKNLETIVTNLENGDVALEDAIIKFQEGLALANELDKTLHSAEQVLVKAIQPNGAETNFAPEQKAY